MKISIITTTFNSSATVKDTLESLVRQSYPALEHIIVDGLSTDKTLEIVKQYPHVCKVIAEADQGLYDAMNKGITLATGEVIGILNSDDLYPNEHILEKVMAAFRDPDVKAVYGDLQFVHPGDTDKVLRTWKAGPYTLQSFYRGWMPPHPAFFVRKEVYDQYGGFTITLRRSADYELMLRFLLKHRIKAVYLPEVLVKMRLGGLSTSSFSGRIQANREDRIAWSLNGLKPLPWTLFLKPLRKLGQYHWR
jgi:glycosyltransferase